MGLRQFWAWTVCLHHVSRHLQPPSHHPAPHLSPAPLPAFVSPPPQPLPPCAHAYPTRPAMLACLLCLWLLCTALHFVFATILPHTPFLFAFAAFLPAAQFFVHAFACLAMLTAAACCCAACCTLDMDDDCWREEGGRKTRTYPSLSHPLISPPLFLLTPSLPHIPYPYCALLTTPPPSYPLLCLGGERQAGAGCLCRCRFGSLRHLTSHLVWGTGRRVLAFGGGEW